MIKATKTVALILTLCIFFGAFSTIGFAEEENTVDPTAYNENSRLFCYVMKILLSKSYAQIVSETEELKPLWMLAREIASSGKYNEDYRDTKEGLKALTSDGYSIKNIKSSLKNQYTKRISSMYAELFSSELSRAEILSKCLVIRNYTVLYSDLVAVTDEVYAIINFCEETIEKIKKDTKAYNAIVEENLNAFTALAKELDGANRAVMLEQYPELQRLYLASDLGRDAASEDIELYNEITLNYWIYASADEYTLELVEALSSNLSADELYYILCGINLLVDRTDLNKNNVVNAKTKFLQEYDKYNKKYVKHNDTFIKISEFAGSLPAGYAVSSTTDKP